MTEHKRPPTTRVRRRTVVKSAAWSLPVVATAAAAPRAAASPNHPPSVAFAGSITSTTLAILGGGSAQSAAAVTTPDLFQVFSYDPATDDPGARVGIVVHQPVGASLPTGKSGYGFGLNTISLFGPAYPYDDSSSNLVTYSGSGITRTGYPQTNWYGPTLQELHKHVPSMYIAITFGLSGTSDHVQNPEPVTFQTDIAIGFSDGTVSPIWTTNIVVPANAGIL